LMERTLCLQFKTAKENYDQFSNQHTHLLQRVSLGHIASYLGISPETLSRIRKNN
jgi:CRP/FNR family transcriptional regulator, anaerobic regulatory protein